MIRSAVVKLRDSLSPRAVLCVAALVVSVVSVHAAPVAIPHGSLELIAENQWIAAGHTVNLGLYFQLEKGWHIYWINPGDSGEPTRVKWQLPSGLTAGAIQWPTPRRLGTSSIVDYGYEDSVILMVPLHADANLAGQQIPPLAAEVKVLVCREMCILGKAQLSLPLPMKSQVPAMDPKTEDLFTATRRSLPRPAPKTWHVSAADEKTTFLLTANLGHQTTQATFFPLEESQIDNAATQNLTATPTGFQLALKKSDQLTSPVERLKGVLVVSGNQAYAIEVPVGKREAAAPSGQNVQVCSAK
jgi:DsbC/DsbD-like thiol-disulfide interchange protein